MPRLLFYSVFFTVALQSLNTFQPVTADVWPGRSRYNAICLEIIQDTARNSIPFRRLQRHCSGWWWWTRCENRHMVRETLSRQALCDRLVGEHNNNNAAIIGRVSVSRCMSALLSPALYGTAQWNNWAGRHCGTWTNTERYSVNDEAYWNQATSNSGIHRQNVVFDRQGTCCDDAWNESGGSEVVVWGWDPKESTNHFGYQGCHVGYPFSSSSGANCIIWVTGEEAFLECIKTVNSVKKRTSAGFWGYGQWNIVTGTCP